MATKMTAIFMHSHLYNIKCCCCCCRCFVMFHACLSVLNARNCSICSCPILRGRLFPMWTHWFIAEMEIFLSHFLKYCIQYILRAKPTVCIQLYLLFHFVQNNILFNVWAITKCLNYMNVSRTVGLPPRWATLPLRYPI